MPTLSNDDLNLLFLHARTHQAWLDKPVDDALLHRIYDLASLAPTSANTNPMRLIFVRTAAGKEKLKPTLSPGNVDKTMAAPVTAILAYDLEFYEKMPKLMPQAPMRDRFAGLPAEKRDRMAFQSATIQGAFLIAAARALGLDTGPMGGFDTAKVDDAFFGGAEGKVKSTLLINIGYGDPSKLRPRNPRLSFDEAVRLE